METKGRVVIAIRGDGARPNRMAAVYLESREELAVPFEAGARHAADPSATLQIGSKVEKYVSNIYS